MSALLLTHQHLPGVTMICIEGDVDATNHLRLQAYIEQVRQQPGDQIVFDLSETMFIDSRGLRVLLDAHTAGVRHGGAVHLAAPAPVPARMLEVVGMARHLPVHAGVDQALRAALSAAAERPS
ncbi:STAS domain-containing protein [Nonomuraea rubra]|uniref:Anti-sigma factor antagonist n=1 Tax=Nonomuraea rubra TaxID=46180 RepID=A0A7X0NVP4_9ACTN|nr:STAS domain-containing protein [Nonomuraea rubra]MBB6550481.1 anti-anti-sigma factor [Nonomuraea rubra]